MTPRERYIYEYKNASGEVVLRHVAEYAPLPEKLVQLYHEHGPLLVTCTKARIDA